ncbi:AUGMIN subunit 4-like isoform X2 [Ipomoea triloba]|uniref:AUGMIN subunit 4-like isoform X2 n=1 Tax=Ipomoea triloba TaxID=35885 RepID=UPI00125E1AEF|nr:AUGMIN subunit 4-like isoform X2 [Ipomoea triloba]
MLQTLQLEDMAEYQILRSREIKNHLDAKCEKAWEEMMKEGQHYFEALVLEQILGAVIKLVKDIKLEHQNKYKKMVVQFGRPIRH